MWRWAIERWPESLDVIDFYFLVLRLMSILGGFAWFLVAPLTLDGGVYLLWLLSGFAVYSGLLYVGIFRWPTTVRSFYLAALVIDLVFVFIAIHFVGELRGSIYTALYLLVAIPAFYFGLIVGLVASAAASGLYLSLYMFAGGAQIFPPSDLILRLAFLFLISGSLGLLAERERRYRREILGLNRELSRRNFVLEQFNRYFSIERIASGVAEKVNNPLGIIAVQAEVLTQDAKEHNLPRTFAAGLETIARQAHQVSSMTKILMILAQRDYFEMTPVDLNDVLERTLSLFRERSSAQGITVRNEISPSLPTILGNSNELQEAFLSIFNNQGDGLKTGGSIRVAAGLRDGVVECMIADDGAGIPKEQIELIFDPFSNGEGGTKAGSLDLLRSLGIIKGHQGVVEVESEIGMGTTFTVSFPVVSSGNQQ